MIAWIAGLKEEFNVLEGKADIIVPLESQIREVGTASLDIEVRYQVCNDHACYPPTSETLHIDVATGPIIRPKRRD